MIQLNEIEAHFWQEYVSKSEIDLEKVTKVEASPAGNFEITDPLIELYLEGKKTAGSSVVEDFKTSGDPLPEVGDYWLLLNSKAEPVIILKTIRIEVNLFKDVPEHVAVAEGEGDLSLEYWKQVHGDLYRPHLKEWGLESLEEASIITEYFQIVHTSM